MNLLELLDRNPNGWGNMPPAQPSQGEIRGRQPTLWDWWNTPIQEGERGGMAPLGTDIYGREVLAANAAQQPGGLFAEPSENRPGLFGYPY